MFAPFVAAFVTLVSSTGERNVDVGDIPSFTFERPLVNGVLVGSLTDLRGAPALFEFWGPRCPGCVQSGVPLALELQETWGEDLQVVLVEVQGAGHDEAARFALRQRWFGGRSLWTSEVPFWPGGNGLPTCVLLGNEGQVLLEGDPRTQSREIGRLVAAEVRARRTAPTSVPEALRPAWAEERRGNFGRASRLLDELEARATSDPLAAARQGEGIAVLRRAIEARFAEARALAEAGYLDEFDVRLDALRVGAKEDSAASRRVVELAAQWSDVGARTEREASRQLSRILSRFYESAGAPETVRDLESFALSRAGTKAGARAAEWARLAAPPAAGSARR